MTYRLMIKTHNNTGKKYLCITSRDDWKKYKGSGTYWLNHLKAHGDDISTDLIYESDDYTDFVIMCKATSDELDVALSEEFANIVPETGYNNKNGKPNVALFWEYATVDDKRSVIEKRRKLQKTNHWIHSNQAQEIKDVLSKNQLDHWGQYDIDTRRKMTETVRLGLAKFFEDEEKVAAWKLKLAESKRNYFNNVSFEVLSKKNRSARLNTSEASKLARKKKIQAVYATGKHDEMFRKMSIERMGANNPAAKPITIEGITYGSVKDASIATGIPTSKLYKLRRENEKSKSD